MQIGSGKIQHDDVNHWHLKVPLSRGREEILGRLFFFIVDSATEAKCLRKISIIIMIKD